MEKATLDVRGMTCGNCVKHVTRALQKAGVDAPLVDLQSGKVELTYDSTKVTVHALIEAVTNAGYPASAR